MKFLGVLISSLFVGVSAQAQVGTQSLPRAQKNSIICTYGHGTRLVQEMRFEGPIDFDFSYPLRGDVALRIDNAPELTTFQVAVIQVDDGKVYRYSYRNPFFVNDIVLEYKVNEITFQNSITGTLTTDYPPVHKLLCSFAI